MIILQEQLTLDDLILSEVNVIEHNYKDIGCNYRLVKEIDGDYYLEFGCRPDRAGGFKGNLLYDWFTAVNNPTQRMNDILSLKEGKHIKRRLTGVVTWETIKHLLTMRPCAVCGGAKFAVKEQ